MTNTTRKQRKNRVRKQIKNVAQRPRLTVFRSNQNIWAQIIDDSKGQTIAESSSLKLKTDDKTKMEQAHMVGVEIAKIALKKKIKEVYFDRGGYKYHGRVREVAEGAREGGLGL